MYYVIINTTNYATGHTTLVREYESLEQVKLETNETLKEYGDSIRVLNVKIIEGKIIHEQK